MSKKERNVWFRGDMTQKDFDDEKEFYIGRDPDTKKIVGLGQLNYGLWDSQYEYAIVPLPKIRESVSSVPEMLEMEGRRQQLYGVPSGWVARTTGGSDFSIRIRAKDESKAILAHNAAMEVFLNEGE